MFRGGKIWKFNNRPKPNKPFGDLVEGGQLAKNKYPGIHTPGAVGHNGPKFLIVYKDKWSQWLPNGINDLLDEPIITKEFEIPDEPEFNPEDAGALIPTNESSAQYAKIMKNKVCHLVIIKKTMFWRGECLPVTDDPNNFPPHIIAAIKAKDNIWYYFDKTGKHCKRADKSRQKVLIN